MNNLEIKFSIIIPIMVINDYVVETCKKLANLKKKNYEIIIVANERGSDVERFEQQLGARIIAAGNISPAIKRDMGAAEARGEYLAFIDDDAYPNPDWLEIAEKYLADQSVTAIGGPQLTPEDDDFWQKVSGAMYMSPLSGRAIIRYWPGKQVEKIDDWPTVNFIVKKEDFDKVGGFDSAYWPGEDTKLCLDLVKKTGKSMLYIPQLVVYHHRRSGIKKHLKQTGNYGLHRGYFARVFPETSRKLTTLYFMPTIFILFLVFGFIASVYFPVLKNLYILGLLVYALAIIFSSIALIPKTKSLLISLMTIPYIVSFHIWYGIRFMQGFLFTKKLNSKLGR